MMKNNLYKSNDTIIRVLDVEEEEVLIIDCLKKTMPKWVVLDEKSSLEECSLESLLQETNTSIVEEESLDQSRKKLMRERYTMISGILPFVSDEKMRSQAISRIAEQNNVSKQTIRHYLCLYLVYQDVSVLVPQQKQRKKELTKDEKNMRWALNKYFYNQNKNSISTAYTMLLKEKYCDVSGKLLEHYPSIHQFRYFYKKNRKMQTYFVSREGLKAYQRNHRPLLGENVQQFAAAVGVGMLDSTICDIYLVNDSGELIGRPVLTACVDGYSSLCCGYCLSWEGGTYSLRNLLLNVISEKQEHCRQYGIHIAEDEWNCNQLPATLITDMGSEYTSETFAQLTELGVKVVNLPPYRPELKGTVEKFFDLIQQTYKKQLKGMGVIEQDFKERGAKDYRKEACLTLKDFEKIVVMCILYYNCKRIVENFPYTQEMIESNIKPYANVIFEHGKQQRGANLLSVNKKELIYTLLPRTQGKFTRFGLKTNNLRYKHDDFTEQYLKGGTVTVAYNPEDVSVVWVIDKGTYIPFQLIETRFCGQGLTEVEQQKLEVKELVKREASYNLQAQIDLAEDIQVIAIETVKHADTNIKGIRKARRVERDRTHIDYAKVGGLDV